jgi:exonuclease III
MNRSISPPPTKRGRIFPSTGDKFSMAELRPVSNNTIQEPPEDGGVAQSSNPSEEPLRIFSWNINGIAPFLQKRITSFFKSTPAPKSHGPPSESQSGRSVPPASLRAFLKRHQWPQIVCLQEVKINSQDEKTKAAVRKAVSHHLSSEDRSRFPITDSNSDDETNDPPATEPRAQYDVHFCLPKDNHNARGFGGKIYGVATLIRSDFARDEVLCVREVDWDIEGRVLVTETKSKIALFNIYAVNGTDNPYRDSTGIVVGTRHDRKLAFHRHLLAECLALEKDGWKVILAGDFNVAREEIDGYPYLRTQSHQHVFNRKDFNRKFFEDVDGLMAIDAWRHVHGRRRGYTYYPRGREWGSSCDRVDLIMVSRGFIDELQQGKKSGRFVDQVRLVNAGIEESVAERGPSDHVPLWVEFNRVAL